MRFVLIACLLGLQFACNEEADPVETRLVDESMNESMDDPESVQGLDRVPDEPSGVPREATAVERVFLPGAGDACELGFAADLAAGFDVDHDTFFADCEARPEATKRCASQVFRSQNAPECGGGGLE